MHLVILRQTSGNCQGSISLNSGVSLIDTREPTRNNWIEMRYSILIALLGVSLRAETPPDCNNPIARDVDVRCACVKDPSSQQCAMVKAGFYEPHDFSKFKPIDLS